MEPLLRVKHSKKVIAEDIVERFPSRYRRFVDATATDSALLPLQARSPKRCVVNTLSGEVQRLYEALGKDAVGVEAAARDLWRDLSKEEFESLSSCDLPVDDAMAAASILYLNQLSTPGSTHYDRNHRGHRFDWGLIRCWAEIMQEVKITRRDPIDYLREARPGDLVYLDSSSGIDRASALAEAASSAGMTVAVGFADMQVPEGVERIPLPRLRPGARSADHLYLTRREP